MHYEEWETLFEKYITEVVDDQKEHIKAHMFPTEIKIREMFGKLESQAAADNASEERGLSMESIPRMLRAGRALHEHAKNLGWQDDGEGAFEYVTRMIYERAAADRESRQVVNKAEVEPEPFAYVKFRAAQNISSEGDVDANEWYEFCEREDVGDDKLPAFPLYATPPATTGASTVLTDERTKPYWIAGFTGQEICPTTRGAALAAYEDGIKAREVAAQAGQVAVPPGFAIVPRAINEDMHVAAVRAIHRATGNDDAPPAIWSAMISAAPSSAKESK